jgi:hypothetical protein
MVIYFVGAVNGQLKLLYNWHQSKFNELSSPPPDWIISVGSFGCFPDPQRVDRATRIKGVGDFPELYLAQKSAPYPTLFVEGPHEDHLWLEERAKCSQLDVLPYCTLLRNGHKTTIGDVESTLDVVGLGRPFSSKVFKEPWKNSKEKYYTRAHVEKACAAGPVDILVSHEGVYGEKYGGKKCEAQGVKKIIYATRPKLLVHGHYDYSREYEVLGVPAYSLKTGELLIMKYEGGKFKRL